jgi:hypothetical protein
MTAPDLSALASQQADAELLELEQALLRARARFDKRSPSDTEAYILADECRDIERRINRTPVRSAIGLAVKLRHLVQLIDNDTVFDEGDVESLRQMLEFVERMPAP